ncbi:MAG: hypothetical protein L0210_14780 [Rhodospirillales bacterium]|nr:hypothetical protein [Rhodospirillales bacterium]
MATHPRIYIKALSYEEHLAKNLEEALDRLHLNGEISAAGQVTPLGQRYAAYVGWLLGHPTEAELADTGR